MQFDFSKFQKAVTRIYDKSPYTLGEVLFVFKEYFKAYEEFVGRAHPRISVTQIRNIIEKMPYICEPYSGIVDISPEYYTDIITQHFLTEYFGCDYNINHFFSGRIRELRLEEVGR